MQAIPASAELLERLREKTGKTREELEKKVEEKTQKFSGFLSREAAVFLLAKEEGLTKSFETVLQLTPINQLQNGQMNMDIVGIAKRVFPITEFQNKNKPGTGKKAALLLADSTGEIFVTFWHQDAEKTLSIPTGTPLLLRNVSVSSYNNQLQANFGYRSSLEQNPIQAKEITLPEIELPKKTIGEITEPAFNTNLEATVEEIFPLKEFTNAKGEGGRLQRIRLKDSTGAIQAVAWNEKTRETQLLKQGQTILIENCRSKTGWQEGIELSLDSHSRIVALGENPNAGANEDA